MRAHHLIIADRGQLRIYLESRPAGQSIPSLELIKTLDFSGVLASPPADGSRSADTLAIAFTDDSASPEQQAQHRFSVCAGTEITRYFRGHPEATWDLAAAAGVHQQVLDHVATAVRRRLRHTLGKDLTRLPIVTHSRPPIPAAAVA